MKRFFLLLLVVVLLITVSGMSFAKEAPERKPVKVFMWGIDGWQDPVSCLWGTHARAFVSEPEWGSCGKKVWTEDITTHVSVTQWINYRFSGTRWDWEIRKPGTFAADCVAFFIQSNDGVDVSFSNFDDLQPLDHTKNPPPSIQVFYGFGDLCASGPPPSENWMAARDLNTYKHRFAYKEINEGLWLKLWNAIIIPPSTRACDYENTGTITLTLVDVKPFIDEETGGYEEE